MEKNKCTKYESLFVFADQETLEQHIAECDDCKAEAEKMNKVSSLIDEVKLYYRAKRKSRMVKLRIACAFMFVLFSALSFTILLNNEDLTETLMYGNTLTAEELGFPVDSYGLLMVDE